MYPLTAGLIVETKELWDELRGAMEGLPIRLSFELPEIPSDWAPFLERLDRMRPDVVLLEVGHLNEPLEVVVKRIRSTSAAPAVFALDTSVQPDAILTALRAGVSEYLYPPVAAPLKAALERLSEARQHSRIAGARGGKVAGFLSAKGGCGATTVACHVAMEIAAQGTSKVLLADLDMQAGLISFLLKTKSGYTVADAVNNIQRLDHSYWQGLVSNGIPNLEVIAAPSTPASRQLPEGHLKPVVAFARTQYDWTILDLGRNLNTETLGLLDLMDETVLVTTQEVPALHHAKNVIQLLLDVGYSRDHLRLVLNRCTKRMDVTIEELESMLGLPVYSTIVSDFDGLHEAYSEGHLMNSNTEMAGDFARLAGKLAGLPETVKKKRFSLFG